MTKYLRNLAYRSTLLIDLSLVEHLEILCERQGAAYRSGICDTKLAISLKWSQCYYRLSRNSCMAYQWW